MGLQHRANGFAFDVVAAHQPGAVAQAEFMGIQERAGARGDHSTHKLVVPTAAVLGLWGSGDPAGWLRRPIAPMD